MLKSLFIHSFFCSWHHLFPVKFGCLLCHHAWAHWALLGSIVNNWPIQVAASGNCNGRSSKRPDLTLGHKVSKVTQQHQLRANICPSLCHALKLAPISTAVNKLLWWSVFLAPLMITQRFKMVKYKYIFGRKCKLIQTCLDVYCMGK